MELQPFAMLEGGVEDADRQIDREEKEHRPERQAEDLQEHAGPPLLRPLGAAGFPEQKKEGHYGEKHHDRPVERAAWMGLEPVEHARGRDALESEGQQVRGEEQGAGPGAHLQGEPDAAPVGRRSREVPPEGPEEVGKKRRGLHRLREVEEAIAPLAGSGEDAQRRVAPGGRRGEEEAAEGESPPVSPAAEQQEGSRRAERDREQGQEAVGELGARRGGDLVDLEEHRQAESYLNGGERQDQPRRQRGSHHAATPPRDCHKYPDLHPDPAGRAACTTRPAPSSPMRRCPRA